MWALCHCHVYDEEINQSKSIVFFNKTLQLKWITVFHSTNCKIIKSFYIFIQYTFWCFQTIQHLYGKTEAGPWSELNRSLGHRRSTPSRKPLHISWTEVLLGHMWSWLRAGPSVIEQTFSVKVLLAEVDPAEGWRTLDGPVQLLWSNVLSPGVSSTVPVQLWLIGRWIAPLVSEILLWFPEPYIYIQYVALFICLFVKAGTTDVSWQAADIISTQLRPGAFTQVFVQF